MEKKKIMSFLMCTLLLVVLSGIVSAGGTGGVTGTIITTQLAGTTVFNVTVAATSLNNVSSVEFYQGTTRLCGNHTNDLNATLITVNGIACKNDSKAWAFYDDNTYTLTARFYNSTVVEVGTAATGTVTVDNTNPTCSISKPVKATTYDFPQTFTMNAYNSSSCVFVVNAKQFVGTYTVSTDNAQTCSYTFTGDMLPAKIYTFDAFTTDASATADTTSCNDIENVQMADSLSQLRGAVIDQALEAGENEAAFGAGGLTGMSNTQKGLVVVALGALVYYGFLRKKR